MAVLKATEQASLLGTFVPPGVIMPFGGATAPSGWLICDGAEYSQTGTYAALFAAIASNWNTQKKQENNTSYTTTGGNFRVPDLRGIFIRGDGTIWQGDSPSLAGWQAHSTRKNGLTPGFSGDISNFNSSHTHSISKVRNDHDFCDDYYGGGIPTPPYSAGGSAGTMGTRGALGNHNHGHTFGVSLSDGDSETKPHNKGVNYIIKY